MEVMKVNFTSFLLTDGLVYGSIVLATGLACGGLIAGQLSFASALMVLLLSYGFFSSVRQLMNATHTALAGVAAAEKVSNLLDIDTTRPVCARNCPEDTTPYSGIRMEHISYGYTGRHKALG